MMKILSPNRRWAVLMVVLVGTGILIQASAWAQQTAPSSSTNATQGNSASDQSNTNQPTQSRANVNADNNADAGQNASESTAINPHTGEFPTLLRLFEYSPVINGILAGLSVLAVMLFIYFILTINSRAMVPADLVDELNKLVLAGKYEQAADMCRDNRRVFISSIVQRCAENSARGHNVIMEMVDTEGRRRADVVWNRISYLADISNVAPMLGLLGTVLGMIRAFFLLQLEQRTGGQISQTLSQGIGQAMATTMFGLVVGIGALVLYSIVKSRVTRTLAESEGAVHSIVDKMQTVQWPPSNVQSHQA